MHAMPKKKAPGVWDTPESLAAARIERKREYQRNYHASRSPEKRAEREAAWIRKVYVKRAGAKGLTLEQYVAEIAFNKTKPKLRRAAEHAEQLENLERLMNLPPEDREVRPPLDFVQPVELKVGLAPDAAWTGKRVTPELVPYGGGRTTSMQRPLFVPGLPPQVLARMPWFANHEDAIFEFVASQDNWAARRKPGDATRHEDDSEFLQQLIDRYGEEEITVRGLLGYPPEFNIPFYKLGTFGAQLADFRIWVKKAKSQSAGGLPDPESDDADHAFGTVMDMMSQGHLVPEIAKFMGWNTFVLGKFVYRYTKQYPEAARDLSLAYDLGLQTLTAMVADKMEEKSKEGRLTNMDVAVLQSKLANFRTLALRLAGSSYAANPSQKTNVNIMPPANGGMRIDVRVHGVDDDVVDVLAHLPRLEN